MKSAFTFDWIYYCEPLDLSVQLLDLMDPHRLPSLIVAIVAYRRHSRLLLPIVAYHRHGRLRFPTIDYRVLAYRLHAHLSNVQNDFRSPTKLM